MNEPIPDWYKHERRGGVKTTTYFGVSHEDCRPNAVLFGAGASFGCRHTRPARPPLGAELYGALKKASPTWAGLRSELVEEFAPLGDFGDRWDFERGMARLLEKLPTEFNQLLRELGYFLCRFEVDCSGKDAFSRLLRALQSLDKLPTTLFATLNYDRVFESAARQLGLRVHYGRHAPPLGQEVWLYKLHGSCTFMPPLYDFQGVPEVVQHGEVSERIGRHRENARQVMSLFTVDKHMIGETAAWLQHVHLDWARMVKHCESLCVVGAAPPDTDGEDAHIWDPIRHTEGRVSYVGFESDYANLKRLRGESACQHLGVDFAVVVDKIADQ